MARRRIITLTTDFGARDGYVASVKGVLLAACDAEIVDVTHEVPPGDVLAGAFALAQVFDYFPAGTVHLAVVDPGVGTERRILAARYEGRFVVAPDNGLISFVDARGTLEGIVSVRNERFFLPRRVGRTFDGRDVMAPVAAALATGADLAQLGPPPERYRVLDLPRNTWDEQVLRGEVLHVDRFGNCVTSLTREELETYLPHRARVRVRAKGQEIGPLHDTYGQVPEGQALALCDSLDRLEIAVRGASAAERLGLRVGDPVEASLSPDGR